MLPPPLLLPLLPPLTDRDASDGSEENVGNFNGGGRRRATTTDVAHVLGRGAGGALAGADAAPPPAAAVDAADAVDEADVKERRPHAEPPSPDPSSGRAASASDVNDGPSAMPSSSSPLTLLPPLHPPPHRFLPLAAPLFR